MTDDQRIHYNANDRSLTIDNVNETDATEYICMITFGKDPIKMHAKLELLNGARILTTDGRDISGRSITFPQEQRIELICQNNSNSTEIKWYFKQKELLSGGNVNIRDGHLIILSTNRDHSGLYQCLIGSGKDTKSANVRVNIEC